MIRVLFIIVVLAAGYFGYQMYADPLTAANLDQVSLGMSGSEVTRLIGDADEVEDVAPLTEKRTWRSFGKTASIVFTADRVIGLPEREGF